MAHVTPRAPCHASAAAVLHTGLGILFQSCAPVPFLDMPQLPLPPVPLTRGGVPRLVARRIRSRKLRDKQTLLPPLRAFVKDGDRETETSLAEGLAEGLAEPTLLSGATARTPAAVQCTKWGVVATACRYSHWEGQRNGCSSASHVRSRSSSRRYAKRAQLYSTCVQL